MCEAIQKAGFDIWIDHGLSQVVGHMGDLEFTHDLVGEVLPVEEQQEEKPESRIELVAG